jgi:LPXTG-motif cell wall-anchored protein
VRRSIIALPIVLALVVGAPSLAWAGHKFRIKPGYGGEAPGANQTYEMEGTLPIEGHDNVTAAIQDDCPMPTSSQQPEVQVVYARVGGPGTYQSDIEKTDADGLFLTTVQLPVSADPVTYRVRLRCADDLTPVQATDTTNLVSVAGRTGPSKYTLFKVTIPLASTGTSSAMLALAGVALLLAGCLLLVYERRLARAR